MNSGEQITINSREVAEMIGKQHKDLLRDIRTYVSYMEKANRDTKTGERKIAPSDFFIESTYINNQNKAQPCYELTKQGCEMVANKLTGEKGVLFTAKYIERFNKMEQQLMQQKLPSYMIDDPIKRAEKWIEEQKERQKLQTQNLILEQQVKEYEPKVTYYDKILQSKGTLTVTQIAKDYGLTSQMLNKILHEEAIQYKQSKQWFLYKQYQDKGYTKSHTYIDKNGETRMSTKWTQKGRLFIHSLLQKRGIEATMDKEDEKLI